MLVFCNLVTVENTFLQTTIENIQEDVLTALDNKNPSVKAETAAFLARCFTKCTAVMLNKKLLKAYSTALIKALNEPGMPLFLVSFLFFLLISYLSYRKDFLYFLRSFCERQCC